MDFKNDFIVNYINNNKLTVQDWNNRPWGAWYLIDLNSMSDKKVIRVSPGTLLSLQYHGSLKHLGHEESWIACTHIRAILSKRSVIEIDNKDFEETLNNLIVVDIQSGGTLNIRAGVIHALANPFNEDIYVIETRKSQMPETAKSREDNITRIYDQTNRNGILSFPLDLIQRALKSYIPADYIVKSNETFDPTIIISNDSHIYI